MESAENRDIDLIKSIAGATQPHAQKPIPLTEDLKQIGVDVTHIAGNTFDELVGGEGRNARDRVATSGNPIRLIEEKFRKFRSVQQKAA